MSAAQVAYEYLVKNNMLHTIRDEIENPNRADSISQLEILSRRGYFSIPSYSFTEKHDKDGTPFWECECKIEEIDYVTSGASSIKKEAKKDAAYEMLMSVMDAE